MQHRERYISDVVILSTVLCQISQSRNLKKELSNGGQVLCTIHGYACNTEKDTYLTLLSSRPFFVRFSISKSEKRTVEWDKWWISFVVIHLAVFRQKKRLLFPTSIKTNKVYTGIKVCTHSSISVFTDCFSLRSVRRLFA
jgi:hypothetical protein